VLKEYNIRDKLFFLFVVVYILSILNIILTLPIGSNEAKIFYSESGILYQISHIFYGAFNNNLDFRLPFFIFGILNMYLFFILSKIYLNDIKKSMFATTIFTLLPGIITSSVIINIAPFVITLVLIFIISYSKGWKILEILSMIALLLIHDASVIFFISLSIYFAFERDRAMFTLSILFTAVSLIYFNGLDIGGKPKGTFLELFGLYSALFSPIVFIVFFYSLYRIWLREKKDILWYISFTAFILSILLSLRQQVIITDFAPYVIVATILMVVTYFKTLNVRLPRFQSRYKIVCRVVILSLIISSLVILFHKPLFYILDDKSKHFAYPFYNPYWIASDIAKKGRKCYTDKHRNIAYQLKYYGIEECRVTSVPKIHN